VPSLLGSSSPRTELQKDTVYYANVHGEGGGGGEKPVGGGKAMQWARSWC
jgi:hypothetical protein